MVISEEEAIRIAADFIRQRTGSEPTCHGARYVSDPSVAAIRHGLTISADDVRRRPCWSVAFETLLSDGNRTECATLVDVDAETGEARFFDDSWPEAKL